MSIAVNARACYGCRVCELVCAYHHRGSFGVDGTSIRVHKDNRTGKIALSVDATCNLCPGRDRPLCVQYCTYFALKVRKEGRQNARDPSY